MLENWVDDAFTYLRDTYEENGIPHVSHGRYHVTVDDTVDITKKNVKGCTVIDFSGGPFSAYAHNLDEAISFIDEVMETL